MPRSLLIIFAIVIALGFVLFASTYTVRFTETAVVTRLGQADENSVVKEPGLGWKLPSPLSSVTKYDKRARFLEPAPETFPTSDRVQLVVQAFVTWRVDDALKFYQSYRGEAGSSPSEHYREAENTLRSALRSALSEVSSFSRDELFTPTTGQSKLADLENAIKQRMTDPRDKTVAGIGSYGIAIDLVGITSIEMPESVTKEVFESMRAGQEKVAVAARAEGEALAASIRATGRTNAERILAFADLRAAALVNRGELEAADYIGQLNQEPALAEFLQKLELLKSNLGRRTTLILPTSFFGIDIFNPEELFSKLNIDELSPAAGGDQ